MSALVNGGEKPWRVAGEKCSALAIALQNADSASSTHRNNWLSLVWLRRRRATRRFAS